MSYTDFAGFTLAGIHSSTLGIIRTSDSDRFNQDLLPSYTDKSISVDGRDGSYYWGRDYKDSSISLAIAYNAMTESNMRQLRKILDSKTPITLVLDERPYKTYYVIPTNNCKLSYICFNSIQESSSYESHTVYDSVTTEHGRVYKGEGNLVFKLYDIYGHCSHKFTTDSYYTNFSYISDWNDAIQLTNGTATVGAATVTLDTYTNGFFYLYNPGDAVARPRITIPYTASSSGTPSLTLSIYIDSNETPSFTITDLLLPADDNQLVIDSELELILSANNGTTKTKIYNGYITTGYFLTIPKDSTVHSFELVAIPTAAALGTPTISYDYLFL